MVRKSKNNNNLTTTHLLYALLIGTSMIMLWRGTWGLLDTYLFPQSKTTSYMLSVIIGLIVLSMTGKIVKKLA